MGRRSEGSLKLGGRQVNPLFKQRVKKARIELGVGAAHRFVVARGLGSEDQAHHRADPMTAHRQAG